MQSVESWEESKTVHPLQNGFESNTQSRKVIFLRKKFLIYASHVVINLKSVTWVEIGMDLYYLHFRGYYIG